MMTPEEIAVLAMARCSEITDSYPKARSVMYRRIGVRQQQLFTIAAGINPDYYGTDATTLLVGGAADLADIADPVPTPEQITRVEVNSVAGGSPFAVGREINVVPVADALSAALPPRMTLRDGVLEGVAADLATVTGIRLYYSRQPKMIAPTDGAVPTEIPSPHDELLVVDLAMTLLKAATKISAAERGAAITSLANEEAGLLVGWQDHVENYGPVVSRFSRTPKGVESAEG
jgi:hypothetical protein